MSDRTAISEAKRRLPLPALMNQLGLGDHAKKSARCPFHEDSNNSFSVWEHPVHGWTWKCHSGCGAGDEIKFLERRQELAPGKGVRPYLAMAGVSSSEIVTKQATKRASQPKGSEVQFDWQRCVRSFGQVDVERVASDRKYSVEFVQWLHAGGLIGLHEAKIAFPVHGDHGVVVGCHYKTGHSNPEWLFDLSGNAMRPLIIGNLSNASTFLVFESQWDAFAVADKFSLHLPGAPTLACIVTRGSGNGKLVQGLIPVGQVAFAWKQNDEEKKNGKRPADLWMDALVASAGVEVRWVKTPAEHKDANDWTRAGATAEELFQAMQTAKAVKVPEIGVTSSPDSPSLQSPAEIVDFVESARRVFAEAVENSTSSTISAGGYTQPAVYPEDSILADWMAFTREREESADVFLLGSVLPVCAALLGRRVFFQWGWRQKYPNVFSILTGKPGDRKSSVILLAENLARRVMPTNAFLPASFSPESLFDEYSEEQGGRPDKLWIQDDANSTLKDWQKAVNGERVAARFLELYDCKGLSESFRRNRAAGSTDSTQRAVASTSTGLLFGATFNIAAFQGQEVRAGMARRFLYYVAEQHGRLITRPEARSQLALVALAEGFQRLAELEGEIDFTPEASEAWDAYQRDNRAQMDRTDAMREGELSRLSSAPMQTLSIAMIFAACRWAKGSQPWVARIGEETLTLAIKHVDGCVAAANHLDTVSRRAEIGQDAELLLAKVRHDFPAVSLFHFATRSELTKRYCANSSRAGSWRPDDLYLRYIPALERRDEARLIDKTGKREVYAFRAEG